MLTIFLQDMDFFDKDQKLQYDNQISKLTTDE